MHNPARTTDSVGEVNSDQPHAQQSNYQVRFDWGIDGANAIGVGADVIVVVDALEPTGAIQAALAENGAEIISASLRNRQAVAEWVLSRQGDKGERFMIAIVAAGDLWPSGQLRVAVEDLFAAGALIDALADIGIDYCSPEAAAASAAFTGLSNATGHLIGASAGGRDLTERGLRSEVDFAIDRDASTEVSVG